MKMLQKNLSNGFANGGFTISDELSTKSPSTKSLEGSGPTLGANLNRLMDHPSTDAVIETSFIQYVFQR